MTLAFHVLWTLCALGTVVFAAVAARRWWYLGIAAAFFGLVVSLGVATEPNAAAVGVAVATVAALALWRRQFVAMAGVALGVLAAVWAEMLQLQGAPAIAAGVAVSVVAAVTIWLTRSRPRFAPVVLLDEGLLLLVGLGLATAALPTVQDGWQSAVTLTAVSAPAQEVRLSLWLIGTLAVSLALGALHAVWSRR